MARHSHRPGMAFARVLKPSPTRHAATNAHAQPAPRVQPPDQSGGEGSISPCAPPHQRRITQLLWPPQPRPWFCVHFSAALLVNVYAASPCSVAAASLDTFATLHAHCPGTSMAEGYGRGMLLATMMSSALFEYRPVHGRCVAAGFSSR